MKKLIIALVVFAGLIAQAQYSGGGGALSTTNVTINSTNVVTQTVTDSATNVPSGAAVSSYRPKREALRFSSTTTANAGTINSYLTSVPQGGIVRVLSITYGGTNSVFSDGVVTGVYCRVYSGWYAGGNIGTIYTSLVPTNYLITSGISKMFGVSITNVPIMSPATNAWFTTTNLVNDLSGGLIIVGLQNNSGYTITNFGGSAVVEYNVQ